MEFKRKIPSLDLNSFIENIQCREKGLNGQGGNGWASTVEWVRVIAGLYLYIIVLVGVFFEFWSEMQCH